MIDCQQLSADVYNGRLKWLCSNSCQINIDLGGCLILKTVILVSILLPCKRYPTCSVSQSKTDVSQEIKVWESLQEEFICL